MTHISQKEQALFEQRKRQRHRDKRYYDYVIKPMLALRHWGYTLAYYVRKPFVFWRKPKKYFITFGDGKHFCPSYLADDARHLGLFDKVIAYWPKSLSARFWRKHGAFFRANTRGYGCWTWKPELVWRTLKRMRDDDILLYMDTGYVLYPNKEGLEKICKTMQELKHTPSGMALQTAGISKLNQWCKHDMLAFLDVSLPLTQLRPNYRAGFLLLRKCPGSMRVMRHWQELVAAQFYFLFDGSPSLLPNHPDFIAHLHDQAVFGILVYPSTSSSYMYISNFPDAVGLKRQQKMQLLAGKITVDHIPLDRTSMRRFSTSRWLTWRKSLT